MPFFDVFFCPYFFSRRDSFEISEPAQNNAFTIERPPPRMPRARLEKQKS